jgi:hypothetical protein
MGIVMLLTMGIGNSSPIISTGLRKTPKGVKWCVDRHSRLSSDVRLSVVVKKYRVWMRGIRWDGRRFAIQWCFLFFPFES